MVACVYCASVFVCAFVLLGKLWATSRLRHWLEIRKKYKTFSVEWEREWMVAVVISRSRSRGRSMIHADGIQFIEWNMKQLFSCCQYNMYIVYMYWQQIYIFYITDISMYRRVTIYVCGKNLLGKKNKVKT